MIFLFATQVLFFYFTLKEAKENKKCIAVIAFLPQFIQNCTRQSIYELCIVQLECHSYWALFCSLLINPFCKAVDFQNKNNIFNLEIKLLRNIVGFLFSRKKNQRFFKSNCTIFLYKFVSFILESKGIQLDFKLFHI